MRRGKGVGYILAGSAIISLTECSNIDMLNNRKGKLAVSISLSFLLNFVLTEMLYFK